MTQLLYICFFQVIWLTFLSISVPLLIAASLRNSSSNKNKTVLRAFQDIVTTIIHQITLHFKLVALKWTEKKLLKQKDKSFAPEFEEIVLMIKKLKAQLTKQIRLQVGLETTYQTIGNTILLFYASSSTRTRQDLVALFQEGSLNFLGLTLKSDIYVAILLVLNLVSLIKAHYQGIIEGFGSDYSLCGKFMVFVTIMCASIVRIMSCVFYFTSTLGLFDLLRHYQGKY